MEGCKSVETTSAILHNQAGRHDLAIEKAQEALAKNPSDAESYFQLGIAYSSLDSVGMAYDHFMRAKEFDPKRESLVDDNIKSNFAKHYNLAIKETDADIAAMEFKKATEADPRQALGFYQLGRAYSRVADADSGKAVYYEKAIPMLDKALNLANPAEKHYIEALSLAGELLAKTGRPEDAVKRFNRLVEEDPTNYPVIERIGYQQLEAEDWKGAAIFLELAAEARSKIGAEDFNLYYNIGVAHYQMRKQDREEAGKAIEFYQKALGLEPKESTTIFNIVAAHLFLEDWQQTVAWGEKYADLMPEDERGWRVLARSYNELGNKSKARQCTNRYTELMQRKGETD
jgi:tetratricopeptide (TPR) repeat protein